MKSRALLLTPRLPWPLDDGGKIGLWQQVWAISRRYETTLVSLVGPGTEAEPLPRELAELGIDVLRVPHRPPPAPLTLLSGIVGRWPYTLARYRNRRLDALLRRLTRERAPHFAFANHLHMATYADSLGDVPLILREHNVEFRWLDRYAATLRNPLASTYVRYQARRTRAAEKELCGRADLVLAIHEEEAGLLRRLAPDARVEVVPVGVDFARFLPRDPEQPPVVLLVGSLGWPPNAEGAQRFLREGWPGVRARVPGVRLRIIGKGLSRELAATAREHAAEVVGYVESMPVEFARAAALVVPLWAGAGARVKIVEALAARVPVVSTPIGAEGLGLVVGEQVLEGDTPAALAEALVSVLAAPERAAALAARGFDFACANYSLEAVAQRTCHWCERVMDSRAGGARSRKHA